LLEGGVSHGLQQLCARSQLTVTTRLRLPSAERIHPLRSSMRLAVAAVINIGDVIAEGTDLHGDGVNIAARLQAECPPGGICVSRAVRDHVHDRLDLTFDELGALSLKTSVVRWRLLSCGLTQRPARRPCIQTQCTMVSWRALPLFLGNPR
jgi:class 3 adenylate cyclase